MAPPPKRKLLAWLPTVILSVAVVGVLVTAGVLIGNGLGGPTPRPTYGQVTDLNWSSFTDDGLDYIAESRLVRIDLSDPAVDATALGLEPDGTLVLAPIEQLDTSLDYDLIVNGGGESPGGIRLTTSEVTILTEAGLITRITAAIPGVWTFRETLNQLEARAEEFGWPATDRDALFDVQAEAARNGTPYSFTLGPGERVGIGVSATAQCDPSGFCFVGYEVTPRVG